MKKIKDYQGDPKASYLYILCSELFSVALKLQNDIKPTTIHGIINFLMQYAENTCITIEADRKSLNIKGDIFHILEHEGGLNVKYDKTEILRFGSIRDMDFKSNTQK